MLGRAFHVGAAVHPHVVHYRHAHRLHWARFYRCRNARHPAEGKRQANHEDDAKPQIARHGLECSRCNGAHNWINVLNGLSKDPDPSDITGPELSQHYQYKIEAIDELRTDLFLLRCLGFSRKCYAHCVAYCAA